ncbi:MAG: hypothetical protein RL204_62 [Bacteroidota bacterium]|jgi:hypothetical protein
MTIKPLSPRKALNKAYLKVKPNRSNIEIFKRNLIALLDSCNEKESEEFHKNLVSDFLKKTYYEGQHFINTKGRNDLVIHNGQNATTSVGVIIEAKKPTNKAEMVSVENLNAKGFQELVLYYLRERIVHKNLEVKHLIVTNINEWFIFDASIFERLFAQNKNLVKQFNDFEGGRLADTKTDFFYKQIAEPFINNVKSEIEFAHFNFQSFQKLLRNENKADDNALIALFKLLSPEHLLKLPFANDSNSLDKRFYGELLHIIGLTETKVGGKKLIDRNKSGERHTGTLLENTIVQLDTLEKLSRIDKPNQFGSTKDERLFSLALELSITWINRILFLKLLEAQLITYHKGDKSFAFLNLNMIKNYDDLNSLFFQVLARKHDDRGEDIRKAFEKVPYLNSSLFEPTDIEQITLFISNLKDDKPIPVYSQTVLKDQTGKKRIGSLSTLEYLFEFLNAYDFSSEGSEEIQEDNKTLINASVLGLIFEKINGYKDGSFFTPGFITMYMCSETIRKAVVQKFNEVKGWSCSTIEELYDKIEERNEANRIVDSIKICDPAVGSGHFLVSALNEMIAVKNDLKILQDREGKRLKEYQVEVVNDELIVTDEEGELFEYNPSSKESQRVQETLFHEKQNIIENCLFGVDINSNSVKICRLRLWIELLKNAYYKNSRELETLPNIDINIKCGNSLVSRFAIDSDLRQALKKSKQSIEAYKIAVDTYRNAESKDQKREMERLISSIKLDFRSEISLNDPKMIRLRKLSGELLKMTNQGQLFEMGKREKNEWDKKIKQLTENTKKLEAEIEEIKANKIYENAFEWRFEFPEVLNNDGDFVGFDVVIGNPPYIRHEEFAELKPYLLSAFQRTGMGMADLFVYFVELAIAVLKQNGEFSFIIPNKWMRAGYGTKLREFVASHEISWLIDFGDLPVFEEVSTYPNILHLKKSKPKEVFNACNVKTLKFSSNLEGHLKENSIGVVAKNLTPEGWSISKSDVQTLMSKIKSKGIPLSRYVDGGIFYGIKTGYNQAFVISQDIRDRLILEDPKSAEIIKPFLAGREIKRYQTPSPEKFLIFTRRGIRIELYPAIQNYLLSFKEMLEPKPKDYKGDWSGRKSGQYKWYEIQDAVDYFMEFEKSKIIVPAIVRDASYAFDTDGNFSNDKTCIIPSTDLNLLGLLNSKLIDFYLKNIASTKQNGYFEYKPVYVSQLPIARTNILESIVSEILSLKKEKIKVDTAKLEAEIDQLVYKLYELTQEEVNIVENKEA